MKPYHDEDGITIYHGDCREILSEMSFGVDLVLTDPPYGVSEATDRKSRGRSGAADCNDFDLVIGDNEPFDPAPILALFKRVILFGANYFADRLPTSPSWIVWDKLDGLTADKRQVGFNDNADVELAWTNLGGPARLFSHRWMGMIKASEQADKRVHPTQKPVSLMAQIIEWRSEADNLILDPYMGSGSTLRAAKDRGRRAIGIEIDERYCEVAAKRLGQGSFDLRGAA